MTSFSFNKVPCFDNKANIENNVEKCCTLDTTNRVDFHFKADIYNFAYYFATYRKGKDISRDLWE